MNDIIELIKQSNPIDEVIEELLGEELNYPGYGVWATYYPCPSCGSGDGFRANLDSQTFKCFSSKEKERFQGDVIDYVIFARQCSFSEAMEYLAARAGIELPRISEADHVEWQRQKTVQGILVCAADYYAGKLTQPVIDYLKGRGFTEETIKERKIGYAPGDHGLYQHLVSQGFAPEEINQSGLVTGSGHDYFAAYGNSGVEGFITLPNVDGDIVLNIQGRAFPDGKPKYKNLPGSLKRPYNFRAAGTPEPIITEGIPDAISALQMQYKAVGIIGVNGFRDEWVELFRKAKKIFVCLDNDAEKKPDGNTGNYATDDSKEHVADEKPDDASPGEEQPPSDRKALEIAKLFGHRARVVQLQGVKDINELLQAHGDQAKKVFQGFLDQSKTVYQILIDRLPVDHMERRQPLNEIMELLAEMDPIDSIFYLDALRTKTGIKKLALEQQLKLVTGRTRDTAASKTASDNHELDILEDPVFIKLGLDIANDRLIMSQNFHFRRRTEKGEEYETWEPRIITSDRKLIPIPRLKGICDNELVTLRLGESEQPIAVRAEIDEAENRWSKFGEYSVTSHLKGVVPSIDMAALYQELDACYRKWFYTDIEDNYIICDLYTFTTYFHQLFMAIPYLHLHGEGGSGKSTLARVFEHLCFNGRLLIEPSDASFFRMAEALQLTAIIDEKENISSRYAAQANPMLMSMLKSRYQKDAFVTRQDKDNIGKTVKFETFGPTIICNVHGLEDILAQRAIPILTQKVPGDKKDLIVGRQPSMNDELRQIRDKLYCAAMEHYLKIKELAVRDTRGTTNARDNELFHPLIVLADFIDSFSPDVQVKAKLETAIMGKLELRKLDRDRAPEAKLKEALLELLTLHKQNKPGGNYALHAIEIIDKINELAGVNQEFAKVTWVGNTLKTLGIIRGDRDKVRSRAEIIERNPNTMQVIPNAVAMQKYIYHYNIRYDRLMQ